MRFADQLHLADEKFFQAHKPMAPKALCLSQDTIEENIECFTTGGPMCPGLWWKGMPVVPVDDLAKGEIRFARRDISGRTNGHSLVKL